MVVIDGHGGYVPLFRIDRLTIAEQRGSSASGENAVPGSDENHVTMACEAAEVALERSEIDCDEVSAVFAASVTDPFAEHGIAAHVAYRFGATGDVRTGDFRSTTRAATDAFVTARDAVRAGSEAALVVCTDILPIHPGSDDEQYAGAGAGAFVLRERSNAPAGTVLEIGQETTGFVERHRKHGKRVETGNASFEREYGSGPAVERATDRALAGGDVEPTNAVICTPDRRMQSNVPAAVESASRISTFEDVGFAGTASFALDVIQFLERAEVGDSAISISYGPGGADAIVLEKGIERQSGLTLDEQLDSKEYVTFMKNRENRENVSVREGVAR